MSLAHAVSLPGEESSKKMGKEPRAIELLPHAGDGGSGAVAPIAED